MAIIAVAVALPATEVVVVNNEDYSILGSILGSPCFGKLPFANADIASLCLFEGTRACLSAFPSILFFRLTCAHLIFRLTCVEKYI